MAQIDNRQMIELLSTYFVRRGEYQYVDASDLNSLWTPLTDGDLVTPELVFSGGDVIMVEVAI